uniref:4-diphosphocytidyl-2-C-methyl-D-erythritol kinase n=1 Tax=Solibacter usitatus (strain Ellin6076) TaxID=234267 RepID=ISPE_SOLUE|nr:RecName: Full=4-diphosphocytidyl-2-C-methyl-D-erythritol kinase; Short=CMK; AltName: Full=4-(cytidine-5'-diphospho)-2-C-methyl-D-erythritol kinase [Candidatus Solibacter usitatus Ellin6076]
MSTTRHAHLRALAKINLDLRVLGKRPDGFHELRTIFQTISLADTLEISFTPARKTTIELTDVLNIADNLVVRAARMVMDAMRATGRIEMRLTKRIPMGAGLGGGSSDAAAVLLALPVLAGRVLPLPKLSHIGEQLGSDVPFFLLGGAATGIGRGSELFPLPDVPAQSGVVVAPGIHVNTAQAYRDLSRRLSGSLTTELQQNKIFSFQSLTWDTGRLAEARNDFEAVVFEQHPKLAAIKRRLVRAGASAAMMSGSGSALYGLFRDRNAIFRAIELLGEDTTYRISLVSRKRYRALWRRAMSEHTRSNVWPLQSRYNP